HLLFWLSLTPFVTGWVGVNEFAAWPVALYGVVFLFSGIAYFILTHSLIALHGKDSVLGEAVGNDFKGKISIAFYVIGIPLSFLYPRAAFTLYALTAGMWLIPNRRIERALGV